MVVVLSFGGFVVLAVVWLVAMAISRKLGAIVTLLYLIGFLLVATGALPGVTF